MKEGRYRTRKSTFHYDRWILISILSLVAFGLLMVSSASMVISDRQYGYSLHYVIRQAVYIALSGGLVWLVTRIPIKMWQKYSSYLLLGSLLLLVMVLVPGIGHVVNGSRRWISLGFVSLQVSEVAKLCAIIYMASYLERFHTQVQTEIMGFIKPMLVLGVFAILLLMEPNFGTLTVITITFLALLFIAGARLLPFSALLIAVAGGMATLAITSPYRLARLTTFINPWSTQYGAGYQLTQSLIAFGRGGLFGVGLGNSIQKLFYLPEAHTDFIFAVIGEELGLIGEVLLIALFTILVGRILQLGRHAQNRSQLFSAYLAYGLGLWMAIQSLINMGVSSGLLPTKGLTLPFISYGGSSMLINSIVIGIVIRIAFELYASDGRLTTAKYQSKPMVRNKKKRA